MVNLQLRRKLEIKLIKIFHDYFIGKRELILSQWLTISFFLFLKQNFYPLQCEHPLIAVYLFKVYQLKSCWVILSSSSLSLFPFSNKDANKIANKQQNFNDTKREEHVEWNEEKKTTTFLWINYFSSKNRSKEDVQ